MNPAFFIFLLVPAFLAAALIVLVRRGRLTVRRWAWAVLIVSWVLSFPGINVTLVGGWYFRHFEPSVRLAPWLDNLWFGYGWLLALSWVVGLVIVLAFKGVSFAAPANRRWILVGLAAILVPLCLFDIWLFMAQAHMFGGRPDIVVTAVSPDGRQRVHVYCHSWQDVSYELVSEPNTWCPVTAQSLGYAGFRGAGPGWDAEDKRLIWSADSQVVALMFDDTPIMACDLSTGEVLKRSAGGDEDHQALSLALRILRLMYYHGGPAR
jgi:hypothetical protein